MKGRARGGLSVLGHGAMVGLNAPLRGEEEREKAQGTLWGGAAPPRCRAWKIPPRGMGVIKAWAVPLEEDRVRGEPGSTVD